MIEIIQKMTYERNILFNALEDLLQTCAYLPLEQMERMEKEINSASEALIIAAKSEVLIIAQKMEKDFRYD